LLAFYIEKDGDFRQSVQTAIYRSETQPNPSLKIHGETVPYRFGDWARVRYEIDLDKGSVNGYVDGKQIARDVALASCPSCVNTLSIRDNPTTTGVLMIGAINISKIA